MFFKVLIVCLVLWASTAGADQTICNNVESAKQVAYIFARGGDQAIAGFVPSTNGLCWREKKEKLSQGQEKSFVMVFETAEVSFGYVIIVRDRLTLFKSYAVVRKSMEFET